MNSSEILISKIAVVGPESTGKSTMAKYLSSHFNLPYVPEYARFYCKDLNNIYTAQDEINMFYGQIALEDAVLSMKPDILIADTSILTIKIWSDHLFGKTPEIVLEEIKKKKHDLYLLMDIDLPWEDDPLRDFPLEREHFMKVWIKELEDLGTNYQIVSGQGEERLLNGLEIVKSFINS